MPASDNGSVGFEPLIYTKIRVPKERQVSVVRRRLLERMTVATERPVTLLSAPAGYGKTTLLRNWAETQSARIVWLALDARDNDSARLGRYLAGACREAGLAVLDPDQVHSPGQVIPPLINRVADSEQAVVFLLDDVHVIESVAGLQAFTYLLDHLPNNARLVLSSRVDPPLPLGRLRAYGDLSELRSAELRFTLDEMATFLEQHAGTELSLDQLLRLQEKTEGWPAGLQLIAHLLRGDHDLAKIIDTFSGDHPYLLDYLAGEVLAGMPPEQTKFLLETSILPELEADLCQQVTGRSDCRVLLERLHADNLFLEPLGPSHTRFRYHSLFREQLQRRLENTAGASHLTALHQRACQALLTDERLQEAIPHAIAAGDYVLSADLISQKAQEAMNAGDAASLQRWLHALPQDIVRANPQLAIWQAWSLTISGQLEEVDGWLSDAEATTAAEEVDIGSQALTIRSMVERFRGAPSAAADLAQQAIETLRPTRPILRAIAKLNLGAARLSSGHPLEAEGPLTEAVGEAKALGHRYVAVSAQYHLGKSYLQRGLLDRARSTFEVAGRAGAAPNEAAPLSVSHLGLALLALERDELPAAGRHLEQAIHLSQWIGDYVFLCEAQQALVRFYLAQRDGEQAARALDVLVSHVERAGGSIDPVSTLAGLRAEVNAALGDSIGAADWARAALSTEAHHPHLLNVEVLATAVQLLMPDGPVDGDQAQLQLWHALLKQGEVQADLHGLALLALRVRLLRAGLLHTMNRTDQGRQLLRESITSSAPRSVLPFLGAGEPLLELIMMELADAFDDPDGCPDFLAELQAAFARHGMDAEPSSVPGAVRNLAVEALTERELEVLALLAQGHTSREVAERLVIAFNTARTHVRNIYRKLDVHNRVEAVDYARRFQLI
ncbi:MAG: LuxR C-terminal-related transcriptional regulator [Anaerolineales bacterium]